MFENPLKKAEESRLQDALKRARGLYYKNRIAIESEGKKGERVIFNELSEDDKAALIVLRDSQMDIPLNIRNFILEVTKEDS